MSCPDCFKGTVHEGQPQGRVIKLHGLDTYVSEPTNGRAVKGIIVVIPDAFGWVFVNNKLLADHYADKGDYRVYLPDFMAGWSAPVWMLDTIRVMETPGNWFSKLINVPWLLYSLIPWYAMNRISASYPRVKTIFELLRRDEGSSLPVGAAGFCWGGKHVALLAAEVTKVNDKPLIDAGFTGHPSMLVMPDDVENIKLPVSFAIGDKDSHLPLEVAHKIRDIVEAKPLEQRGEMILYPDCNHGFCVRADISFEDVAKQAAAAEDQCIQWFNKQFKIED
ncbi:alpha/beta-hydrolase [Hyaloscypha variabilis]